MTHVTTADDPTSLVVNAESLRKEYRVRGRAVSQSHATVAAVHDVSLTLHAGESLGVIGESGSGKSTLALMIAGLEAPTGGRVEVCGTVRAGGPRKRGRSLRGRDLQIVFQDPYSSLDPRQRVEDVIDEILKLHFNLSGSDRRRRVVEILDRVGLDERRGALRPSMLSGGERQRVAIARAIAAEPKVLILDEAVSALDVSIQAQILNLLADLRSGSSIAYLFLSHDLSVVRFITDRLIVLRHGRIVEDGPTERVLSDPRQPYTQELLASVPRPGWKPRRLNSVREDDQ